jgi:hypothetical protein
VNILKVILSYGAGYGSGVVVRDLVQTNLPSPDGRFHRMTQSFGTGILQMMVSKAAYDYVSSQLDEFAKQISDDI